MGLWDLMRSKHMKTVIQYRVTSSQLYLIIVHIFSETIIFWFRNIACTSLAFMLHLLSQLPPWLDAGRE